MIKYFLIFGYLGLFMMGCSDLRQLNPNAENISLATHASKFCRFLGEIESFNVHRDLDIHTSLQNLKIDDIHFLKNEGAKIGANLVVLVQHTSIASPPEYRKGISGMIIIYAHSIKAKAYWCAPNIIFKLRQQEGFSNVDLEETPLYKPLKS